MKDNKTFNYLDYYSTYPNAVISRPGYPARAVYKSTLMFKLFGDRVFKELGSIDTYVDIGGCFGFSANAMAFYITKRQGYSPRTFVFEISQDFIKVGKQLFPSIDFIEMEFNKWEGDIRCFDLITLFDVIEHVEEPEAFLSQVSSKSRYVMLKTPMETSGEWRGNKPPSKQGDQHKDGHINFFNPFSFENLLNNCNLEIIDSRLIKTIIPDNSWAILCPENMPEPIQASDLFKKPKRFFSKAFRRFPLIPWSLKRKIVGGGNHICLCKSRHQS